MGEGLEGQPGLRGARSGKGRRGKRNAGLSEKGRGTLVSACLGKVSLLGLLLAPAHEGKGKTQAGLGPDPCTPHQGKSEAVMWGATTWARCWGLSLPFSYSLMSTRAFRSCNPSLQERKLRHGDLPLSAHQLAGPGRAHI